MDFMYSQGTADEGSGTERSTKSIWDPIHGYIKVEPLLISVVDTPQFQRLRQLKQLGCAYFVYPGASHNRFEHCLGVSHLAGELVRELTLRQPELCLDDSDYLLVKMAGLVHDLGHGPFSHVFDNEFLSRARPDLKWHHEQQSCRMLEYLVDQNGVDMDTTDVRYVQSLINGERPTGAHTPKKFLYDVVANSVSGIDVDKFDYLSRDTYNLGMHQGFQFQVLLHHCRVIDDEICFRLKEVYSVHKLFETRYSMFKQVYAHRAVKAVEYMMAEALTAADPVLNISEAVNDEQRFTNLTDAIFWEILSNNDPGLRASQQLLRRIQKREFFKCAGSIVMVPKEPYQRRKYTAQDITSCQIQDGSADLRPEDIIVNNNTITYSSQGKNPLDYVHFFTKPDGPKTLCHKNRVSMLYPSHFTETEVRVYVRDPAKLQQAKTAFLRFRDRLKKAESGHRPPAPTPDHVTRDEGDHSDSSASLGLGSQRYRNRSGGPPRKSNIGTGTGRVRPLPGMPSTPQSVSMSPCPTPRRKARRAVPGAKTLDFGTPAADGDLTRNSVPSPSPCTSAPSSASTPLALGKRRVAQPSQARASSNGGTRHAKRRKASQAIDQAKEGV